MEMWTMEGRFDHPIMGTPLMKVTSGTLQVVTFEG